MHVIGLAVRCYQCGSDHDKKGQDNCGAYAAFDKSRHIAVECNSDESHMPGSFCVKIVQQGPKGFICKYLTILNQIILVYWFRQIIFTQIIHKKTQMGNLF